MVLRKINKNFINTINKYSRKRLLPIKDCSRILRDYQKKSNRIMLETTVTHYWKSFPFHRIEKHVSKHMLKREGYTVRKRFSEFSGKRSECLINYDEDYVIYWLSRRIIRTFEGVPLERIQELVAKAYELEVEDEQAS